MTRLHSGARSQKHAASSSFENHGVSYEEGVQLEGSNGSVLMTPYRGQVNKGALYEEDVLQMLFGNRKIIQ